jgi:hypothetical protein
LASIISEVMRVSFVILPLISRRLSTTTMALRPGHYGAPAASQKARAPAHVETGQALDPTLFEEFMPATDRVVVQQNRIGDVLTAPPVVEKHQGRLRAASAERLPTHRARDQLVAILLAQEAAANHTNSESAYIICPECSSSRRFPQASRHSAVGSSSPSAPSCGRVKLIASSGECVGRLVMADARLSCRTELEAPLFIAL